MSAPVLFQTMPPLSVEEYGNLEQSIKDHGIQVPVLVDEEGVVIDGHHRQKIAASLGIDCPTEPRYGLSEAEKRSLSISLNIDRRQLSREQRRSIIEASLKADPELSNREHARRVGADDKTVGTVRRDLETTAEIPQSDVRISGDGRERPATQPARPVTKFTDTHKEEIFVDTETGEIVDRVPAQPALLPAAPRLDKSPKQQNFEQTAGEFGRSIFALVRAETPEGRQVILNAWAAGSEACSPVVREYVDPSNFRAIARGLNALANQWEATR